jgi:serine/threonine-protein kinase RsbW
MHDVPEGVVDDLKLAVSEACTNAVAVNAATGEHVRVVAAVDDGFLRLDVLDAGPGIDPALLERDPELDSEEFTFERGLSLPVIRGLVDELEILPREPRGSVLRMRLSFSADDAQAT